MALTIWCNSQLSESATRLLTAGLQPHRLVFPADGEMSTGKEAAADPAMDGADIAFGQPNVAQCLQSPRLRWLALNSAGYTRYDREDLRETFRRKGTAMTSASGVYADPCAQHAFAMMLALGRQLLPAYRDQLADRPWHQRELRAQSQVLTGQTVLLLGFGGIGRRLADLLAPFGMTIYAVRRQTRSEAGVRIIPEEDLTRVLPLADHVVNILPENDATRNYVNARRLGWCRRGARFYNIGRGTTVDQAALIDALQTGRLGSAYLDVTDPEPLPPDHPLWTAPNCYITPHTAGGAHNENDVLVRHFLRNLEAFTRGEPLTDRVV